MRSTLCLLIAFLVTAGCARSTRNLPLLLGERGLRPDDPNYSEALQIQYLGGGGFLLRRGNDAIATAPFYSNPNLLKVMLRCPIESKPDIINKRIAPIPDVAGLLVGHAHYDHLMDVPVISSKHIPQAKVYGSKTTVNVLSSVLPASRLVDVETHAGTFSSHGSTGRWHKVTERIRIMALRSEHAPHVGCITMFSGEVKDALDELPKTAYGWREGQTLAYLIDILDSKEQIDYRIFFHDSAVNCPTFGGLPLQQLGERRPDIDILCAASFHNVEDYPEYIVGNHGPQYVLIGHWEDFFRSALKPAKAVRATNVRKFLERLACVYPRERTILPAPGASFTFRRFPCQNSGDRTELLYVPPPQKSTGVQER